MNITEDYVSFEVAKLLKEKGFDEKCGAMYDKDGHFAPFNFKLLTKADKRLFVANAPTLQMAMKYLREVHKKNINIIYDLQKFQKTDGSIEDVEVYEVDIITKNGTFYIGNYNHYESAAEAAIKYCLENLI